MHPLPLGAVSLVLLLHHHHLLLHLLDLPRVKAAANQQALMRVIPDLYHWTIFLSMKPWQTFRTLCCLEMLPCLDVLLQAPTRLPTFIALRGKYRARHLPT